MLWATLLASIASKATDANVVHTTGAENIAGVKTFSSSPIVPTPINANEAATKGYVDAHIPTINNATTLVKGIIKLAGDLGGTADFPTVP